MSVYTMGIWQAKPGREDGFVAAWWELAESTGREFLGVEKTNGTLLRDRDQPGRFVSFGPWDSLDQIAAWRAHAGLRERVTRMNEFLESFTPAVLDSVLPSATDDIATRISRLVRGARVPARQRALGSGAHWGPILSL